MIQYHQLLSAPSGARTLRELVDAADRAGFGDQFQAALDDGGRPWLCCVTCDHRARPEYVTVVWAARTEGASDPADELYVAAIELPGCRARGVYIAPHGPAAGAADAELLRELPQPLRHAA